MVVLVQRSNLACTGIERGMSKSPHAQDILPLSPKYCSGSGGRSVDKKRRNPGVLIKWIHAHSNHPYPTKSEKDYLTLYAGMNLRQLNDWFANARRNIKKKGGYESWKEKHPGHSACLTVSGE